MHNYTYSPVQVDTTSFLPRSHQNHFWIVTSAATAAVLGYYYQHINAAFQKVLQVGNLRWPGVHMARQTPSEQQSEVGLALSRKRWANFAATVPLLLHHCRTYIGGTDKRIFPARLITLGQFWRALGHCISAVSGQLLRPQQQNQWPLAVASALHGRPASPPHELALDFFLSIFLV